MIIFFLALLLVFGVALTDLLAFWPINLLHLVHLPQWLFWLGLGGAIAWLIGSD
ncbi:MAG: hypothetical protein AAGD25_40520 [Cyanobacteria bacterium P01_F01_bin.150]